jgi:glutathione synthase/RimK-type ligase-like ATP-grasp enzyme
MRALPAPATMCPRIALVNDHRWIAPDHPDDYARRILTEDRLLTDAFERRGARVERVAWSDADIDWPAFDALVIRQTWDYFERLAAFTAWLDRIEGRVRIVNPLAVLRWNLHKRYLVELAEAGVPTVPTRLVPAGSDAPLDSAMDALGSDDAVIKPAVSGAGRETYRVTRAAAASMASTWNRLVAAEDMMIQPFMPAIVARGEVSLMVMDGAATHAVRKIAAPGEFRVQDDHGGTVHAHAPTDAETGIAERAIAAVPGDVAYARVDLVDSDAGPRVMELELIEPELFFRHCPEAAERLAAAVLAATN